MARKKKQHDDEPDDLALGASETPEPEAEDEPDLPTEEPAAVVAEDPEQPPEDLAEQSEGEAPVEEEEKPEKKRRGPKLYTLQVSRNDADWADVAHTTVTTYHDHRDRQQAAIGYTKAQAVQVAEDWERAGYAVRLVEVGKEPEPEPEPLPEPPVEP